MGLNHEGWLLGSFVSSMMEHAEDELDNEEDEDDYADNLMGGVVRFGPVVLLGDDEAEDRAHDNNQHAYYLDVHV